MQRSAIPSRPVVAIVGGAKVCTKLDLIGNLSRKVDVLVIGGAMANTFLAAQGNAMGKSLQEAEMHETALRMLARGEGQQLRDPAADRPGGRGDLAADAPTRTVDIECVPADMMRWMSARTTVAAIEARLRRPRRWSGTARSAPSRSRPSTPRPSPSRNRWRR